MHILLFPTLFITLGHILVNGAPATPTSSISLPANLYGEYFDDLDSWDSKDGSETLPAVQEVFAQSDSSSAVPTSTMAPTGDRPPYMGPGIELTPSPIPIPEPGDSGSPKKSRTPMHPYAPGLHKFIVVLTVVGAIGFIMLCCFLINERHIFCSCCFSNGRQDVHSGDHREKRKMKHKRLMAEQDSGTLLWIKTPDSPGSDCLSSPSPSDISTDGSDDCWDELESPCKAQDDGADYPRSKWSMTISDYGVTPRTSAATSAHHSLHHTRIQPSFPPILISPPQAAYLPDSERERTCGSGSRIRTLSGCPPVWRYGHVRNQSAPVTPSIASSVSDMNVDGRNRSSSTSSGRAVRVRWK